MTPQELAARLEQNTPLPTGILERFNGYGVMGQPFTSGHVLALRRFPASSIGPGYTSVWHRNPVGDWTFYSDTDPEKSCSRFFGRNVKQTIYQQIKIEWKGAYQFQVTMPGTDFNWEISVGSSFASMLMNGFGKLLPDAAWQNPTVLKFMGATAGLLLHVGKVNLTGITPNRQQFKANPRKIWLIRESTAFLNGEDLGPTGPLSEQAQLAGFYIPQKGILAFGQAYFELFDPEKHAANTSIG